MTLPESECVPNTILELLSDNDTVLTFVFFVLGWFICRLGFPDRRSDPRDKLRRNAAKDMSFFWLLLELRGSVFYRLDSVFGGLFIAALGGVVQYMHDTDWEYAPRIHHHYAFQALGAGVTFAIVFRTQLAWNRYWEAVTQLHFMYSKWADAFSQFQAFSEVTRKNVQEKDPAKADRIRLKQWRLKINYALLSTYGSTGAIRVGTVAADRLTTGDNQRMEEVKSKGVRTRNTMRVNKETQDYGLPKMRLRNDHNREESKTDVYVVFELPSAEQTQLLMASNDIITTVMYWIVWDLADCMKDIDIAPPIQSRMYQELGPELSTQLL
eukprot:symbB.v1.2.027991.t1/scaffold2917.1/size67260/6